jgi:LmbE family N-acetylglucosaminyl deacetylase
MVPSLFRRPPASVSPHLHRSSLAGAIRALRRIAFLAGLAAGAAPLAANLDQPVTAGELLQELRAFHELGSVLYVAAHPDDENNRLLPYLARGRALRVGYLSLTRGDGGQNLIGPELGTELGVIRTQELLAARRIDGAEQYFARARDFGFSKDSADTLKRWDRQQVLADIVRVIRTFRPDVIVTRFSPVPGGTHGHHTASAILALEAFKLSGDPAAFPEQLHTLQPWQAKRILWNSWVPPGTSPTATALRLDAGGYDPLLGESFGEIGARGRSMHKSQGEGRPGQRGPAPEYFDLLAGEPAQQDLMDGVDTSWARIPGAAEIGPMADALVARFDPQHPAASVDAVLGIRAKLAALAPDPLVVRKRQQIDRILQACLGLFVETVIPQAQFVPGETMTLHQTAIVRTEVPVRWLGWRRAATSAVTSPKPVDLKPNEPVSRDDAVVLPADTPFTHPYWLEAEGTEGMFRVDDPALIGRPVSPPAFPVEQLFEIRGQTLVIAEEPVQVITDPVRGELRRPLEVIPPVSLRWAEELELVRPGETKSVGVDVVAARPQVAGTVAVDAPPGWQVRPATQPFQLAAARDRARFTFEVTAPPSGGAATLTAEALVAGRRYHRAQLEIRYDHIPVQLLQPPARTHLVSFALAVKARQIGYVPGAGDLVPEALRQMGCTVTTLAASDLSAEKLRAFDAVVIGVRAFNTRSDLDPQMPALFTYAERGGTVIVQYNTAYGLLGNRLAPYPLELSRDRVTDAAAPVTILTPEHPALLQPNPITAADFSGWVQERARFVPRSWDPRFTALLAMNDPGEKPLAGSLLIARHGQGYFVYTSLPWFRELPAGVPGAYRLFANLLSLGR